MKWYCEHLKGRHAETAKQCAYLDNELSDGAILTSNGGRAGAWYFDEDIDTRPVTTHSWQSAMAYACDCKRESECPVLRKIDYEIDAFVNSVMEQGLDFAWHVRHELYRYIMTKNNPSGAVYPRDIQLPREYALEAETRLYARLMMEGTYGHAASSKRQPA